MQKVYIIRHAQTEDNVNGIIQGQTDSPITSLGIENTKNTAKYFKNKRIDMIISSPLGRAYNTAKMLINETFESEIVLDARFMEIDLQPWEKKEKNKLMKDKSLSGYYTYKKIPHEFAPLSGENLIQLQDRVLEGYNNVVMTYNEMNIIIVSHNVSIRTLLCSLQNINLEHLWDYNIPSSSITEIEIDSKNTNIINIGMVPENKP